MGEVRQSSQVVCLASRRPAAFPLAGRRVWVATDHGALGGALARRLRRDNCEVLLTDRRQVNLSSREAVDGWLAVRQPDAVVLAASGRSGSPADHLRPVESLREGLVVAANVIGGAHAAGVRKLLVLGASGAYPAPEATDGGDGKGLALDPAAQWRAVAKVAGVSLARAYRLQRGADYIAAIPAELYGADDVADPLASPVIPALLRRLHEARLQGLASVRVPGRPGLRRAFLHLDDCADALARLLQGYSAADVVDIPAEEACLNAELARTAAEIVGFRGDLLFEGERGAADARMLTSAPLRNLGWSAPTPLRLGMAALYRRLSTGGRATAPGRFAAAAAS